MTKIRTGIKKKIFHIRKILEKKEVKVIPILLRCIMWVGASVAAWEGVITADTHHQLITALTVISWEGQAQLTSLQGPVHPSNNRPLSPVPLFLVLTLIPNAVTTYVLFDLSHPYNYASKIHSAHLQSNNRTDIHSNRNYFGRVKLLFNTFTQCKVVLSSALRLHFFLPSFLTYETPAT